MLPICAWLWIIHCFMGNQPVATSQISVILHPQQLLTEPAHMLEFYWLNFEQMSTVAMSSCVHSIPCSEDNDPQPPSPSSGSHSLSMPSGEWSLSLWGRTHSVILSNLKSYKSLHYPGAFGYGEVTTFCFWSFNCSWGGG